MYYVQRAAAVAEVAVDHLLRHFKSSREKRLFCCTPSLLHLCHNRISIVSHGPELIYARSFIRNFIINLVNTNDIR